MKLHELLKEMPRLTNKELDDVSPEDGEPAEPMEPFFVTDKTIKDRGYDVIGKRENVVVLLKNDHETALIGTKQERHDGEPGVLVYGQVMFKLGLKLGPGVDTKQFLNQKVLQVDIVEVVRKAKFEGLGTFLYSCLVQKGFTVISDTLQFKGGKALWKKIARSHLSNEMVMIMDHGDIKMTDDGKPIAYDGSNIPDSDIWSEAKGEKDYVLLVYTKKHR